MVFIIDLHTLKYHPSKEYSQTYRKDGIMVEFDTERSALNHIRVFEAFAGYALQAYHAVLYHIFRKMFVETQCETKQLKLF